MQAEIIDDYEYERRKAAASQEAVIEQLAWLMDSSIGIGGVRFGLDPIIGLIPGFGDVIGGMISTFIVLHAHRAGVPKATLMRMVANVGIDSLLGSVPFVGDLFDFAWKANSKNLELYRSSIRGQRREAQDWGFVILLLAGLGLLIALPILVAIWIAGKVF